MNTLTSGQKLVEHGIEYERLANGDGRFSINIMVDAKRIHRVIGVESDGVTRRQAEEYIEQVKTQARAGRLNLPQGRKLHKGCQAAFQEYLDRLDVEGGKDLKSKKHRVRDHLTPFFGNTPLSRVSTSDIERYKKLRLETGAKPGTINREILTLSHIFSKALDWGWIDNRPCVIKQLREDNRRTTFLTIEQCQRLLEEAKKDACPAIYPFCAIALQTAMRRMEILSIRLADINLENLTITIPKAKAGARVQPMTRKLAQELQPYITAAKEGQVWLFPSERTKVGHMTCIEKPFRRAVAAAGLDVAQVNRHCLRHTAITHLVQAGVDLPTVQRISGHKTLAMVGRYSHQDGSHIQAAMDKLQKRYIVPKKSKNTPASITQELHKALLEKVIGGAETLGGVEPMAGFEPATYGLRNRCSTS